MKTILKMNLIFFFTDKTKYKQNQFEYRILITIFFIFMYFSALVAQQDANFLKSVNEIDEYMLSGEYNEALPLLLNLVKSGHVNGKIEFNIGKCYLNTLDNEDLSIPYFQQAFE